MLPITMVSRLQNGDIIRVRMLEQPINGDHLNKNLWDWTFVVAFINPGKNELNTSLKEI